jgi:hypothetical protein
MRVLIVTGIEGARNCAAAIQAQLESHVEVAENRRTALAALCKRDFDVVVVDETLACCDPVAAEAIWVHSKLAIPLQINFALTGAARLIREIRAAKERRSRETALARLAAEAAIDMEMRTALSGLLLQTQCVFRGQEVPPDIAERLRVLADLAGNLCQKLGPSLPSRGDDASSPP